MLRKVGYPTEDGLVFCILSTTYFFNLSRLLLLWFL